MSFLEIYTEPLSAELGSFLNEIKPNVERYSDAKQSAQKERMIIIGKVVEYQKQFPQRSADHRALSNAMAEEGWRRDTIDDNAIAYKAFKALSNNVNPEFRDIPEVASVSQLKELGRASDGTLLYDAAMCLKRTGKLPSVKALRGHKGGHYNNKFEPIRAAISSQNKPQYSAVPEVKQPEPYVVPKREPINITPVETTPEPQVVDLPSTAYASVDVETHTAEENELQKLDPVARNVMRLTEALAGLSADDVYGRPELIEEIRPHLHTLEGLVSSIESASRTAFRR